MGQAPFQVLDETKIPALIETAVYIQKSFLVKETFELEAVFILHNSRGHHSRHNLCQWHFLELWNGQSVESYMVIETWILKD